MYKHPRFAISLSFDQKLDARFFGLISYFNYQIVIAPVPKDEFLCLGDPNLVLLAYQYQCAHLVLDAKVDQLFAVHMDPVPYVPVLLLVKGAHRLQFSFGPLARFGKGGSCLCPSPGCLYGKSTVHKFLLAANGELVIARFDYNGILKGKGGLRNHLGPQMMRFLFDLKDGEPEDLPVPEFDVGGTEFGLPGDDAFQKLPLVCKIFSQIGAEGDLEQTKAERIFPIVIMQPTDQFHAERKRHVPLEILEGAFAPPVFRPVLVEGAYESVVERGQYIRGDLTLEAVRDHPIGGVDTGALQ